MADSASAQKITVLDVLGNDGLFSRHLPNYEARPQQVSFATLIEQGIADRQHVVGELGTGCLYGDAEIIINRGGNGSRVSLADLCVRFNGGRTSNRKYWDMTIPTYTQRADGGVLRLGRIQRVWESGIKETFTLTTEDGRSIRATSEHPFLTSRGWLRLGDIVLGDHVVVRGAQATGRSEAKARDVVIYGMHAHPHAIRRKNGSSAVARHRLVAEARQNHTAYDDFVSLVRSGQTSEMTFLDPKVYAVHHDDHDHGNDDPSNLVVLAHDEHRAHHGVGAEHNVLFKVALETVISIERFGFEPTYDIEIADEPHNFLADGFVVHNSGKSFAGLVPAVLSGEKVVYATYMKSLQEQIGQKDAPFLAQVFTEEIGRPVRYAVLKGRGNYTCLRNMEELEQGGGFRSPQAATAFEPFADWVHAQREAEDVADVETYPGALPTDLRLSVVTGTDECTGHRCRFYDRCFGERAKARAQAADIIIVNHRLLCLDAQIREESEAHAAILPDHSLLVVDECFPVGTLIDGVPIQDIRVGDTVRAFNTATGGFERRSVVRLFTKPTGRYLAEVLIGGRKIRCTPNHKFWTQRGWVRAEHLIPGYDEVIDTTWSELGDEADATSRDGLYGVRSDGHDRREAAEQLEDARQGVLLHSVRYQGETGDGYGAAYDRGATTGLRAHAGEESDGQPRREGEDGRDAAPERVAAGASRVGFAPAYGAAIAAGNGVGLGDRGTGESVSTRRGASHVDDRDRSGWAVTRCAGGEGSRRHEGSAPAWIGVDDLTIYESASDRTFGGLCPNGLVYNFEVEGLHTYVAEGIVVSNCHNLEDVIRDSAGIEITPGRLNRLGWLLKKYTVDYDAVVEAASKPGEGDVANRVPVEQAEAQHWVDRQDAILVPIQAYLEALKEQLQDEQDSRERRLGDERPTPVGLSTLGDLVVQLLRFGQAMEGSSPFWLKGDDRDAWLKLADNTITLASEFLTVISPDEASTWVRRAALDGEEGKLRVILEAKPIDVAPIGRRWFFSGIKREQLMRVAGGASVPISTQPPLTTISMSATIATNGDVAMYRARVGCTDAATAVEGSPFDYRNHALLYLPGQPADLVPVQKRDRVAWEQYVQALCAEMRGLTLDARGGAFLLFTSRSMLTEVHTRIAADLEDAGLLVLKQGEMSLRKTVELFKADGNAVLFGLKSYGEGVDVQGDALRLVVIDKVPFNPPTDLVWKALCDHLDRNGGNSFRDLSMPNAIITLKQFVGRLIRSTTDRGVMAILDGRVRTKFYGREILANLPPAPVTSDPQEIQRLYAAMQRARTAPVPAPVPPPVAVVVPTGPRPALRPGRLGQGRDAGVTRSARPAR